MESGAQSLPEFAALTGKLRADLVPAFTAKVDKFLAETAPNAAGWTSIKVEGDFKSFSKKDPEYVTLKAEHLIPFTIEQVTEVVNSYELRLKFDKVLNSAGLVKNISEVLEVARTTLPGKMLVSAREFVTYRIHYRLGPDTRLDLHFSADDSELAKTKGFVRGIVDMQATLLKREGNKTRALFYSRVNPDLKLIPQSIIEKVAQDCVNTLKYLAEFMATRK